MSRPRTILLATTLIAGCSPTEPPVAAWPLGQTEARARLEHADIAGFSAAMGCAGPLEISALPAQDQAVSWQIDNGLAHLASFTIRLRGEAGSTIPEITISQAAEGHEAFDGTTANSPLRQPLRAGISELVAAALETRPFDAARANLSDCAITATKPSAPGGGWTKTQPVANQAPAPPPPQTAPPQVMM